LRIKNEKYPGHSHQLSGISNIFFDIAAQVGIVGVAFLILSFFLVIRQAFQTKYAEGFCQKFILFALGGSAIMLITGIPNQPLHSPHGVYLFGYLGGICYSSKFADAVPCQQSISCSDIIKFQENIRLKSKK
jgi:O-antigen ligase